MSLAGPGRLPAQLWVGLEGGGQEAWGRLERLSSAGATVSTLCELSRGRAVLLSFDANGERFSQVRARVTHAEGDADGYCLAEVDFESPLDRRRLARALADLLSR